MPLRAFIALAILTAVLLGEPYAALLVGAVVGVPFAGTATHHDGTQSFMAFDRNMPLPRWMKLPPGAFVTDASRTGYSDKPDITASVDIGVHMTLDALKQFYTETLTAEGFDVVDEGFGPMDSRTAAAIGVAGLMTARRNGGDIEVFVHFYEETGILRPVRHVGIGWRLRRGLESEL